MTEHTEQVDVSHNPPIPKSLYVPEEPIVEKLRQLVAEKKEEQSEKERLAAMPRQPYRRVEPRVGRNDPCPCGSGKKYKKCHMGKDFELKDVEAD